MARYNQYQQLHFTALFGAPSKPAPSKKPVRYGLFHGANQIAEGSRSEYGLLVWKKKEMIRGGAVEGNLKIRPL